MATKTSEFLVGVVIGEGSFGQVVHAKVKETGRDVAIKLFEKMTLGKYAFVLDSVWTEQIVLRQLKGTVDQDHVVQLSSSFDDAECVYLVMECCFCDLAHTISSGLHSPSKSTNNTNNTWLQSTAFYANQLMEAVNFIHAKGVIHCDLTPHNVLCTQSGRLKLADFGCAMKLQSDGTATSIKKSPTASSTKTQSEANGEAPMKHRGTSTYASPELLKGTVKLTKETDYWSLGCILHAFHKNKSPFDCGTDSLSVQAIFEYVANFHNSTRPAPVVCETMSDGWKDVVNGFLQPISSERLNIGDGGSLHRSKLLLGLAEGDDDADRDGKPLFLPEPPLWHEESSKTPFKDGKDGWSSFLI